MPQTRTKWIILTVVVAILGTIWISVNRVGASDINPTGRPPSPDIGHPAPDFTLQTPDGSDLTLSDLRGQPVLVNFWATWCPPCRAEIPALEQVHRATGSDFIVLGVDVQENPGRVANFIDDYNMTYPVVLDEDASIAQMYRVRAFPTSYLVDENGVVIEIYHGAVNEPQLLNRLTGLRD